MNQNHRLSVPPHLMWIYTEFPIDTLDAATWRDTTRELHQSR